MKGYYVKIDFKTKLCFFFYETLDIYSGNNFLRLCINSFDDVT